MHTWQQKFILASFIKILIFSDSYAASAANIQTQHCVQCGSIMLGAAHIDFNAIRWAGGDTPGVLRLTTPAESFGFTGTSLYLTDPGRDNQWKFKSSSEVVVSNPNRFGSSIHHFFAPNQAGTINANHLYTLLDPSDSRMASVQGSGIPDNEINPALTLVIQADINVCPQQAVCPVNILTGQTITFTVTPQVHLDLVPAGVSESPQYLFVELLAREHNTNCFQIAPTFTDRGLTENSFEPDDYFHYMQGSGPNHAPEACIRYYPFLVSADKSFQFQVINQRDTDGGYVQYDFHVRGHYDPSNPHRWPGSQKSFQLRTTTSAPTHLPTAQFTLEQHNNNVLSLNAAESTTPNGNLVEYQWHFNPPLPEGGTLSRATAMTEVAITQSGTYQITLTVIDNIGSRAQSASQSVTIQTQPVSAEFTAQPLVDTPLTVQLDASGSQAPGNTITQYEWTTPGQAPQHSQLAFFTFDQAGSYPITLTVTAANGSSSQTTQTITVWNLPTASIRLQQGDQQQGHAPHSITLIPIASADNAHNRTLSAYEWLINGVGVQAGLGIPTALTHEFAAGSHQVELKVSDDKNGIAFSAPQTITVWRPPVAQFTAESNERVVQLTSTSKVDERLSIQAYQWQITNQDGQIIQPPIENGKQPAQIELTVAGTYEVALQITDSQNAQAISPTQTVSVEASKAIIAKFAEALLFAPAIVKLDASTSYTTHQNGISDYTWAVDYTLFETPEEDTLPYRVLFEDNTEPSTRWFELLQPGDYRIRLTVTNDAVNDTTCDNITVLAPDSAEVTYPSLDDEYCHAWIATPTTVTSFADSHFRGGISLDGEPFENNIVLSKMNNPSIEIAARILVAPEHVGQQADILIALKHNDFSAWYLKKPIPGIPFPFDLWAGQALTDIDLAHATAFDTQSLTQIMDIPIFKGTLDPLAGTYTLYIGYRLIESDSVNIIFNPKPIQFEIQGASQ